jgi:cell division protein FtsB
MRFMPTQHQLKQLFELLKDVRVIGLIAFGAIAILVTWSGVNVLQQNFTLQQQIAQLDQEIAIQKLENRNLELRNEYYNTDQYLELQARRQFGLAAPGETVLLVPERVALENSVPPLERAAQVSREQAEKPFYQENLEAWADFLFRGFRSDD